MKQLVLEYGEGGLVDFDQFLELIADYEAVKVRARHPQLPSRSPLSLALHSVGCLGGRSPQAWSLRPAGPDSLAITSACLVCSVRCMPR